MLFLLLRVKNIAEDALKYFLDEEHLNFEYIVKIKTELTPDGLFFIQAE